MKPFGVQLGDARRCESSYLCSDLFIDLYKLVFMVIVIFFSLTRVDIILGVAWLKL